MSSDEAPVIEVGDDFRPVFDTFFICVSMKITFFDGTRQRGCRLIVPPQVTELYADDTGNINSGHCEEGGPILEIVLPENLKILGPGVFDEFEELRYINFPAGLERIGSYAFRDCRDLQVVKLPDSTEHVGRGAFQHCTNLHTIRLSPFTEFLGPEVFEYCVNLPKVLDLSNLSDLFEIKYRAFGFCTSLERAILPMRLQHIDREAFIGCSNLRSVVNSPLDLWDHHIRHVSLPERYSNSWLFPFFGPQRSVLATRQHERLRFVFMFFSLAVTRASNSKQLAYLPPEMVEFVLSFLTMSGLRF